MKTRTMLVKRSRRIVQTEGWRALVSHARALVAGAVFRYRVYYLSEYSLKNLPDLIENDIRPAIEGVTFRIVTSNHEADELEAEGFEFRSYPFYFSGWEALDAGAIAVCVFVGKELGAIGWEALDQRAMDAFNEPPIPIDFAKGECFSGGIWTNPKYRRRGLRTYRTWKKRRYLADRGVRKTQGYAERRNVPLLRGLVQYDVHFRAEGRYLKVLWWRSWRERPLPPGVIDASTGP